jgi:hypothetical protein
MKDYIMECPTTPSTAFSGGAARGYVFALNNTFTADAGNAVNVAQFWTGVDLMNAYTQTAALDPATAATRVALNGFTGDTATLIAPLANASAFAPTPAGYAPVLENYPLYRNASTTATEVAQNPSIFPPGYFCPVGQGKDFIRRYRDLSPENPATTNIAYAVNCGLFVFFVSGFLIFARRSRF